MSTLAVVGSGSYVLYTDSRRYPRMVEVFASGNILPPMDDDGFQVQYFPRPELEQRIKAVLSPTFSNDYYLIKGEVGTGKTRLITEMCRQLAKERGAKKMGAPVYVMASQGTHFSNVLADAVHFYFDEHINFAYFASSVMQMKSLPSSKDDHLKLSRVLEAIENAAYSFVKQYGRPAVIVIDNINHLTERHNDGCLEKVQEKAKLWSDTNIVKIILVSNNEDAEMVLKKVHSNWSRAESPIIIEDLDHDEAIAFLKSNLFHQESNLVANTLTDEDYEAIYNAVGGRIQYLLMFKRDWTDGVPIDVTIERLMMKEGEKFLETSKSIASMRAIEALYLAEDKVLRTKDMMKYCSLDELEQLQQSDIVRLAKRPQGLVITFESKLTESVVKAFVESVQA